MAGVRGRVLAFWALCACVCVVCGQQSTPRHGTPLPGSSQASSTTTSTTTTPDQGRPSSGTEEGKPQTATDDGVDDKQQQQKPAGNSSKNQHPKGSSNDEVKNESPNRQTTNTKNTSTTSAITNNNSKSHSQGISVDNVRELASKRTADAPINSQQLRSAPSLAGTLLLLLITLVIAGSLFVMLLCFVHKWRENMGTGRRYPRVVYSMLRQSEEEPEDVLGEILINIGLADPSDFTQPPTPSSTSTSPSPQPSDHQLDLGLDVPCFTTVPLRSNEAAFSLLHPGPEESDEELLQ